LRLKSESIALMQGELIAGEREAALKDQALRHLRARLQEEEDARQKQVHIPLILLSSVVVSAFLPV